MPARRSGNSPSALLPEEEALIADLREEDAASSSPDLLQLPRSHIRRRASLFSYGNGIPSSADTCLTNRSASSGKCSATLRA